MTLRRLQKELRDMATNPVDGIFVVPKEGDMMEWHVTMSGLQGTPYETGEYQLTVRFPNDYPFKPPDIKFTTKMYHPSVHSSGRIQRCLLKIDGWSPAIITLRVLEQIRKDIMCTAGNLTEPMSRKVASQLETDLWQFISTVLRYNELYAGADSLESRNLSNLQTYPFLTVEQCEELIPNALCEYMANQLDINMNVAKVFGAIILEYCSNQPFGPFYNYEPWRKYCIHPNYYRHEREEKEWIIQQKEVIARQRMEAIKTENSDQAADLFSVTVKTMTGQTYSVQCAQTDDLLMLKLCIAVSRNMPLSGFDLFFNTQRLEDEERLLSEYGVQAGSTIYQMGKLRS